ncbi:MAG: redoxin domain-containing protein [Pyrinomonadaceae bacterium]|nr:redoxin domain-containing protein [Pyrinomonadaceae bacterium]
MRILLTVVLSAILFASCNSTQTQKSEDSANLKRYDLKGTIISVDRANKKAKIKHEEIPGFMEEMTMDFFIKEDWVWDELTPGAEINAVLVIDNPNAKSWLEKISVTSAPKPGQDPLPVKEGIGVKGKPILDFSLTNQNGEKISPNEFKGKAWALTFIYSECPLPDFCILMSKNFSDLANEIANDEQMSEKYALLSISFDPKRDTPAKLKSYGLGYLGKDSKATDFKVWQLAVGKDEEVKKIADFFGLGYEVDEKDSTQFTHSLRTAVIDPNGNVHKIFTGNDWKAADLLAALKSAGSALKPQKE